MENNQMYLLIGLIIFVVIFWKLNKVEGMAADTCRTDCLKKNGRT
jgi:hypothetical protein